MAPHFYIGVIDDFKDSLDKYAGEGLVKRTCFGHVNTKGNFEAKVLKHKYYILAFFIEYPQSNRVSIPHIDNKELYAEMIDPMIEGLKEIVPSIQRLYFEHNWGIADKSATPAGFTVAMESKDLEFLSKFILVGSMLRICNESSQMLINLIPFIHLDKYNILQKLYLAWKYSAFNITPGVSGHIFFARSPIKRKLEEFEWNNIMELLQKKRDTPVVSAILSNIQGYDVGYHKATSFTSLQELLKSEIPEKPKKIKRTPKKTNV